MSKTVTSGSRNPAGSRAMQGLDFKNKHYVLVQKDSKNYESPLESMLDELSPTREGESKYRVVADGEKKEERALTQGRSGVLLECSKEDQRATQAVWDAEAVGLQRAVDKDEKVIGGAPGVLEA